MNFGEILSRAWQIIWKHKVLWIFGIFAALGQGGGGNGGGNGGGGNGGDGSGGFNFGGQYIPWASIEQWFEQNWWIFIVILVAVLALIVVFIILATFGRIGLARGAWQADEGKAKLSFGQLFGESSPFFWRVFGLSLLIMLLWIAFFIVLLVPAIGFTAITAGLGALCLIPFFLILCCLLIPVGWAVSIITEQAIIAITCENMGLFEGLSRGWQILRANLGQTTIMFLILGIGGGIVRFLIALPALAIAAPLLLAAFADTTAAWTTAGIVSIVLFCIYVPIALALNGVVTAYTGTAWALTYRRLTGLKADTSAIVVNPG